MAKPEVMSVFQDALSAQKPSTRTTGTIEYERTNRPAESGAKDGHQSANIYQAADSTDPFGRASSISRQYHARLIDLLKAIQDCSGQKQPEIVGTSPHQTGQPHPKNPHGSEFSSQLVRQNAPQKGKQHLEVLQ